jgi:uncharacterized RDD family membrane protein YckC
MSEQPVDRLASAGLLRRLAGVVYDSLLLVALWMVATGLWLLAAGGRPPADGDPLFQLYLLVIAFLFFGGFWIRGGRTLGMQAWRMRVVSADGRALTWRQAAIRFFAAILSWLPLGAGYLWCLVDRDRNTLHDRLSGTRTVVLPKR